MIKKLEELKELKEFPFEEGNTIRENELIKKDPKKDILYNKPAIGYSAANCDAQ